eukprot:755928-Hanusia_phi.AAC.2
MLKRWNSDKSEDRCAAVRPGGIESDSREVEKGSWKGKAMQCNQATDIDVKCSQADEQED